MWEGRTDQERKERWGGTVQRWREGRFLELPKHSLETLWHSIWIAYISFKTQFYLQLHTEKPSSISSVLLCMEGEHEGSEVLNVIQGQLLILWAGSIRLFPFHQCQVLYPSGNSCVRFRETVIWWLLGKCKDVFCKFKLKYGSSSPKLLSADICPK